MKNIVAILHGALSEGAPHDEQDTLMQVETVREALRQSLQTHKADLPSNRDPESNSCR